MIQAKRIKSKHIFNRSFYIGATTKVLLFRRPMIIIEVLIILVRFLLVKYISDSLRLRKFQNEYINTICPKISKEYCNNFLKASSVAMEY